MYDRCVFFGDMFGSQSFDQYFQARRSTEYNGYMKAHFDTVGYFNNNYTSENPSTIGRYSNLLAQSVQYKFDKRLLPFPKIYVVVPDNDIINLCGENFSTTSASCLLNHIMTEYERGVAVYREYLLAKCLKMNYPQFLWIEAPLHDNFKDNSA